MKFKIGQPPLSENFIPEKGIWKWLKIPKSGWVYQAITSPFGFIPAYLIYLFSTNVIGVREHLIDLRILLVLLPIHELLHSMFFPSFLSENTVIGIYFSGGCCYAYYNGEMTRNRWILVLITPLLILTILPIVLMFAFNVNIIFFIRLAFINSLLSGVDLFNTIRILFQIPNKAVVRNKGFCTYWRQDNLIRVSKDTQSVVGSE